MTTELPDLPRDLAYQEGNYTLLRFGSQRTLGGRIKLNALCILLGIVAVFVVALTIAESDEFLLRSGFGKQLWLVGVSPGLIRTLLAAIAIFLLSFSIRMLIRLNDNKPDYAVGQYGVAAIGLLQSRTARWDQIKRVRIHGAYREPRSPLGLSRRAMFIWAIFDLQPNAVIDLRGRLLLFARARGLIARQIVVPIGGPGIISGEMIALIRHYCPDIPIETHFQDAGMEKQTEYWRQR